MDYPVQIRKPINPVKRLSHFDLNKEINTSISLKIACTEEVQNQQSTLTKYNDIIVPQNVLEEIKSLPFHVEGITSKKLNSSIKVEGAIKDFRAFCSIHWTVEILKN